MAATAPSPKVGATGNPNLLWLGVIMSYINRQENRIGEAEYNLTFTGRIADRRFAPEAVPTMADD